MIASVACRDRPPRMFPALEPIVVSEKDDLAPPPPAHSWSPPSVWKRELAAMSRNLELKHNLPPCKRKEASTLAASPKAKMSLRELMACGAVEAGEGVVSVDWKGNVVVGDLRPDATLSFLGQKFPDLKSWGMRVTRDAPGSSRDPEILAWEGVRYKGTPLAVLRANPNRSRKRKSHEGVRELNWWAGRQVRIARDGRELDNPWEYGIVDNVKEEEGSVHIILYDGSEFWMPLDLTKIVALEDLVATPIPADNFLHPMTAQRRI